MTEKQYDLRERLLDAQEMTPELREAFHKELDATLEYRITPRSRLGLVALLFLLFALIGLALQRMLFYNPGPLVYGVWATFTAMCAVAALWIGRSIWHGRILWPSYSRIAEGLTVAAALITVLALGAGSRIPQDPTSVFGVLYAFLLLIICLSWSLYNRIAAAEMAAQEHLLRIEYRLAELSGRLNK